MLLYLLSSGNIKLNHIFFCTNAHRSSLFLNLIVNLMSEAASSLGDTRITQLFT